MVYFVATPIGNLKDITLRALEVLKCADVIYCEDTRHTIKLLNAYEIKKPLKACHKFNERAVAEEIVNEGKEKQIAIVSDAGMPVISDPGHILCRELKKSGINYTVVAGANAMLSALILSAFNSERFTFLGFLPDKKSERDKILKENANVKNTLLFHCAPQDLDKCVLDLYDAFGNRKACAVREISKVFEEAVYFELKDGYKGEKRGEFVLVVEGADEGENPLNKLSEREHILFYVNKGFDKMSAIKLAAKDRGVSKSELYKFSLDID